MASELLQPNPTGRLEVIMLWWDIDVVGNTGEEAEDDALVLI